LNFGTEFAWRNLLALRGGYKLFYDEESYSLGVGIKGGIYVPVNVDVSYADYGRLGDILRLTVNFGIL
jgi:hypothetical protein